MPAKTPTTARIDTAVTPRACLHSESTEQPEATVQVQARNAIHVMVEITTIAITFAMIPSR